MDKRITDFLIRAKRASYAGKERKPLHRVRNHTTCSTGKANSCIMTHISVGINLPARKPSGSQILHIGA